ncbi:MAG: hypothetical protein L0207_07155 [Chlamydiae bacterium]|nr:hypothetical protein [Chlamydiota bacterium]
MPGIIINDIDSSFEIKPNLFTDKIYDNISIKNALEKALTELSTAQENVVLSLLELSMKKILPSSFYNTKQEKLKAIEKYKNELVDLAWKTINGDKEFALQVQKDLSPSSPFIQQLFSEFYEKGIVTALDWYDYFHSYSFEAAFSGQLQKFLDSWKKKILSDFEKGDLVSFPMVVNMIENRKICGYSLVEIPPFNDMKECLRILQEFAKIGVKVAQDVLCWHAYLWGTLGADGEKINVDLTVQDRIQGLWELAEKGFFPAQEQLAAAYYHNSIGKSECGFSEKEAKDSLERLKTMEKGKYNFYITCLIWENGFNGGKRYSWGLTKEERIAQLKERAKKGDESALRCLWEMYEENTLGDTNYYPDYAIPLNLTQEERVKKIEELRKIDDKYIDQCYAGCIVKNLFGDIPLNLTVEQRFQWLEDQAFNLGNESAQRHLLNIYKDNHMKFDEPLEQPFNERFEKICELALLGNKDACWTIAKFCLDNISSEIKGSEGNQMSQEEKMQILIRVILEGGHWDAEREKLIYSFNEPWKTSFKLIFSLLKTLDISK